MKVLMLGWEFPPHISGGLGTACAGIVRGLSAHDVEVTFVVPRARGEESSGRTRVVCAETLPDDARAPRGVHVRALASALLPYQSAAQFAAGRPSHLATGDAYAGDLFGEVERYARRVEGLARRETHDLVHAHDWMTFPAGAAAARAAARPFVAHVHACEDDRNAEHPDERIRDLERDGLAAADRVVCVSRYTAERVRKRYGVERARLRVVHNAVEPRRRGRARAPRGLYPLVLFLGRVTAQKGPGVFLEAAARVHALEPDARFVVSGSGDLLPSVIEQAARLGIAHRVRFTGFLGREDVERVYAMADVYVMPSVSEPFGIAPLEALLWDVPVIVSRQSGVAEVLDSALKVDSWDVDELANKVLAVLRRPALRRTLRAAGRREVAGLRWESRGALLREVYEEVVA